MNKININLYKFKKRNVFFQIKFKYGFSLKNFFNLKNNYWIYFIFQIIL